MPNPSGLLPTDLRPIVQTDAERVIAGINGAYAGSPSVVWNLYGPISSRPPAGIAGRLFITSDGAHAFVDDGTAWRPQLSGHAIGTQPAAAATWTPHYVFATPDYTASITDDGGDLLVSWVAGTNATPSSVAATKLLPSTSAYTVEAMLDLSAPSGDNYPLAGLMLHDSAGAYWQTYGVSKSALDTYFESFAFGVGSVFSKLAGWWAPSVLAQAIWFRIAKTGVTPTDGVRTWSVSANGRNWETLYSETGAGLVAVDSYGVLAASYGAGTLPNTVRCISITATTP